MVLKYDIIRPIKLLLFDFDGVFTNNLVWVSENGEESVCCSREDGLGIIKMKKLGLEMGIVSSEKNAVVSKRANKLQIKCWQGVENKLDKLINLAKERKIELFNIAFVGNDINDQECLKSVGLPIVVSNAHKDVIKLGKEKTLKKGGDGAVREICDAWFKALTVKK